MTELRKVAELDLPLGKLRLQFVDAVGMRGGRYNLRFETCSGDLRPGIGLGFTDLIRLRDAINREIARAANGG